MRSSTQLMHILYIEICTFLIPLSLMAQQRVVVSPFYSDYAMLTDSLPEGWSVSPYIQLGVRVDFPQGTTLSALKQYQFEKNSYFSTVMRPFTPVTLQYGQLRWNNLNLMTWSAPKLDRQELEYIETKRGGFSLSYNDCSFIAGTLSNKNGVPSFSYIHYEDWGSLFPTKTHRSDTTTYVLQVNPSLFYLLTDKGLVDLYTTESINIPPNEKFPSLFLFYKPLYLHKIIQYKKLNISLLIEKEALAAQLTHKISSGTIDKDFDNILSSSNYSVPADSILYNALKAIDHIADFSSGSQKNIAIAKTGLRFCANMGQKEKTDTISASFSLTLDSVILADHETYYQPTLLHELLHFVIDHKQTHQKEISPQEKNFFSESVIEYLARYLYCRYITPGKIFTDSIDHSPINSSMLKKARHSIHANTTVSVGFKCSDETANTAWVYYDLFPTLLHQLAASTQADEESFVTAVYSYLKRGNNHPQNLQDFFSFLKEQGFHLQKKQMNNISMLLKN